MADLDGLGWHERTRWRIESAVAPVVVADGLGVPTIKSTCARAQISQRNPFHYLEAPQHAVVGWHSEDKIFKTAATISGRRRISQAHQELPHRRFVRMNRVLASLTEAASALTAADAGNNDYTVPVLRSHAQALPIMCGAALHTQIIQFLHEGVDLAGENAGGVSCTRASGPLNNTIGSIR